MPSAREQLLALTDRAEVFVESWRPGVADRLGLGYDVLHARNPALVYVSISGFGEDSGIDLPGYEPIVQAVLGSMSDQVGASRRAGVPRIPIRQHRCGVARRHRRARRAAPRARGWLRSPRPDLVARRRPRLPLHDVGRERRVDRVDGSAALAPVDGKDATRDALVRMRRRRVPRAAHRCRRRVRARDVRARRRRPRAAQRRRHGHGRAADR